MTWRVAKSILVLHAQLKAGSRAAPPATAATEWGTIGDPLHDPMSDHTPHDFPGWGLQIVTAGDFPDRPDLGLDARQVLDDIRRSRDPRVKYGISHGQMFSSYTSSTGIPPWTWRTYTGTDGHFTHGHLSVVGDARADGEQPWQTIGGDMGLTSGEMAVLAATHDRVLALSQMLPSVTGASVARGETNVAASRMGALVAAAAADEARDQAVLAAIQALATVGGVDAAPILAAIAAVRAETHDLVVQLQQQLAEVQARNVRLASALAAAGAALDDADDE